MRCPLGPEWRQGRLGAGCPGSSVSARRPTPGRRDAGPAVGPRSAPERDGGVPGVGMRPPGRRGEVERRGPGRRPALEAGSSSQGRPRKARVWTWRRRGATRATGYICGEFRTFRLGSRGRKRHRLDSRLSQSRCVPFGYHVLASLRVMRGGRFGGPEPVERDLVSVAAGRVRRVVSSWA